MNKKIKIASAILAAGFVCLVSGTGGNLEAYAAKKIVIHGREVGELEAMGPGALETDISGSTEAAGTAAGGVSSLPQVSGKAGWNQSQDAWQYFREDGSLLTDGLTPDGYYVDIEGKWRKRSMVLLDETISLPDTYRRSTDVGSLTTDLNPLERLNKRIRTLIGSERLFYVYDDSIRYHKADSGQGTFLMGIYKNPSDDGWQLRLSTRLNKSLDRSVMETCDYAVFRFFLGQVSHVPERVSEAIYDSWQGNNSYGINPEIPVIVGDVAITYSVEDGAGVYLLENGMKYRK